jgi:LysR family transcriptional regulator, hypochlorite-specific transcription factor HypT
MRLEWLEDVLAVAETGSFQEAADRRRLTQSAFSRRIQHIEEQIGVALFDRSRKPVQLLPTTVDQRDQIAKLANDLRQLVSDLRRGERMASNRIAIASQHALTTSLTPLIVRAIHARDPATHIRLRSANLDECFSLLLSRQVDIAIVYRLPGEDHPISQSFVETVAIGTDRLVPVFAASETADLNAQFASGELPYISFPPEVFLGRVLDEVILPRVNHLTRAVPRAETALTLAALELAAVGVGVAWVPTSLARRRIADGSLVDLSSGQLTGQSTGQSSGQSSGLPSCQLDVTSVRLFGNPWPVADSVWSEILASGA